MEVFKVFGFLAFFLLYSFGAAFIVSNLPQRTHYNFGVVVGGTIVLIMSLFTIYQ